jgi:hypothetical protein
MPQEDKFAGHPLGLSTPGVEWVTLTPSDTEPLPFYPKAVICGGGGTNGAVVCVDKKGNESVFHLEQGQRLPVRPHQIKSTGTTATPLIAIKE